jgi:SAM-dependent methyltransferase
LFDVVIAETRAAGIQVDRGTLFDLGCGSGQAMVPLAPHFNRCVGADISETQVEACARRLDKKLAAADRAKCSVHVGGATEFNLPAEAQPVDIVTVAQAMHWFDMPAFGKQLEQHLRPGGLVFAWMYGLSELEPAPCNDLLVKLDAMLMRDGHWPAGRKHIDDGYRRLSLSVPLPVEQVRTFRPVETRSLDDFVAYLSTWSGINRYIAKTGHSAVLDEFKVKMAAHLEGGKAPLRVTLPIRMYVFRRPLARL